MLIEQLVDQVVIMPEDGDVDNNFDGTTDLQMNQIQEEQVDTNVIWME